MIFSKSAETAASSFRAESRSAISSRCSSLSTTCAVENGMSMRFLPSVPESVRRSTASRFSLSSCGSSASDWSNAATISCRSFT